MSPSPALAEFNKEHMNEIEAILCRRVFHHFPLYPHSFTVLNQATGAAAKLPVGQLHDGVPRPWNHTR